MESSALTVGFLVTILSVVLKLLGKNLNDFLVEKVRGKGKNLRTPAHIKLVVGPLRTVDFFTTKNL